MSKLKKIAYLSGLYTLGSVFEKGISFIFIPIYTAYLGTAEYGILGLMMVTSSLVVSTFFPPVDQGFVRHYYSMDYKDKQGLLLFNSFLLLFFQSLLFAALFFALSQFVASTILGNEELKKLVQVYSLILFFQPLCDFLLSFLKQTEKAKLATIIYGLCGVLSAGFVLAGLVIFNLGIFAMIYGLIFGYVFKICCMLPSFWKESTHKISFSVLAQPLIYGYQRFLTGCVDAVLQGGDRYVIVIFSTVSSVGLYNFGWQIANIITILFVTPLLNALDPAILKLENNPVAQKEFIKKITTYFGLLGMFIWLSLSMYSREFIELMATREEFWESWVVVPIIAASCLLYGINTQFMWGLVMKKKGIWLSAIVVFGGIVNIGLNFLFIPNWGIVGASYATLSANLLMAAIYIYFSSKLYDLKFDIFRLSHITIVSVGLYILSQFTANTDSLIINLSIKMILLFSYPLIIFMTGYFLPHEIENFKKALNFIRENGFGATYAKIRGLG